MPREKFYRHRAEGKMFLLTFPYIGLLRANSCARQLRGFCFPGSSRTTQVPPIKHPLALGAAASRFWVPQENGARKRRKNHVLPQLSDDHRLRRRRPGAASSAEQQRLEVHRSFRRHAAVVEKNRRRMGLENRVASPLCVPSAARRKRRTHNHERALRSLRGPPSLPVGRTTTKLT